MNNPIMVCLRKQSMSKMFMKWSLEIKCLNYYRPLSQ